MTVAQLVVPRQGGMGCWGVVPPKAGSHVSPTGNKALLSKALFLYLKGRIELYTNFSETKG
jgi:hypothetical protein